MIARDLIDQLATMRAHPLTETNVHAVDLVRGRLILDASDPYEDKIAELTEDLAYQESAAKASEAEAQSLTAELDRVTDAEWQAADRREEIERIRATATAWAKRVESAERDCPHSANARALTPDTLRTLLRY
jgi:flagellar biosynthesis regulator FlaF